MESTTDCDIEIDAMMARGLFIDTSFSELENLNSATPNDDDDDDDVMNSVILFVTGYILVIGTMSVAATLCGADMESAFFGVWTSIGNIGYGFGPLVVPTGTFADFPTAAKWVLILVMLLGRLGMLAFLLLLLPRFWRR